MKKKHIGNQVPKSEFKPRAFELMRRVSETGAPLVITEHGKPTLKLIPYESGPEVIHSLRGQILDFKNPLAPVGNDDWENA